MPAAPYSSKLLTIACDINLRDISEKLMPGLYCKSCATTYLLGLRRNMPEALCCSAIFVQFRIPLYFLVTEKKVQINETVIVKKLRRNLGTFSKF